MAVLYNLARMTTSTTGTGAMTLGSAVAGFLSFASAGIQDGDVVTYAIQDGTSSEIGRGTYTASGTTLSRSVLKSTNSNNPINLSGSAEVFITPAAEDFTDLLRKDDNLASVADADTSRYNLYAAPFDAMAYLGLQINGFHQISQEHGNTAVTTTEGYPTDQWQILFAGPSISAKRVAAPFTSRPDIPYGIEIEATTGAALSAGHYVFLNQKIEGQRVAKLGLGTASAVPISIGFLVRSNVSGRGHVGLRNGANSRSRVIAFDVVADTDTWVEIPAISGDTSGTWDKDTTAGLQIAICIGTGSDLQTTAGAWQASNSVGASDTTNFAATTGNKVWVGPVVILPGLYLPSSAEIMKCMRHYDDELWACKRYFQKSFGPDTVPFEGLASAWMAGFAWSVTSIGIGGLKFAPSMRVGPSMTFYKPAAITGTNGMWQWYLPSAGTYQDSSATVGSTTETEWSANLTTASAVAASAYIVQGHWVANARM